MKRFSHIFLPLLALLAVCCTSQPTTQGTHPEWTYNSVVYEMNVRQQTPEGTFAAAEGRLTALQELGIDIIWLMPIHPIGVLERKGTLGSYYAIRDYYAVNPEFGTMDDFEHFLDKAHKMGFRVILDYVANHTSPDAAWATEKPVDWYVRDSTGAPIVQYDWTDIAKLNFDNADVQAQMTDVLKFWVGKGVDGFRCDAAKEMPDDFWREAFAQIRVINPDLYLLAEAEGPHFHQLGFDATYAWELHHLMNDIARGDKSATDLKKYLKKQTAEYPCNAFRLMFTSNHDENSWAGTEFERMGDAARVMALLTFTLPNAQPLIYTGQEMGFDRRFEFFEKDPVQQWVKNEYTDFYKTLIRLHHDNEALAAGERGGELKYPNSDAEAPEGLLFFSRATDGNEVIVAANLSPSDISFELPFDGSAKEFFSGKTYTGGAQATLPGWQWLVFVR